MEISQEIKCREVRPCMLSKTNHHEYVERMQFLGLFRHGPVLSFVLIAFLWTLPLQGQDIKTALSHGDYDLWKRIEEVSLAHDGSLVAFIEKPGFGDGIVRIVDRTGQNLHTHARSKSVIISEDGDFVAFIIQPPLDTLRARERIGTKEEDMPCDTLGIYDVTSGMLTTVPCVRSFTFPDKWSDYLVYILDEYHNQADTSKSNVVDSTATALKKKVGKENGYHQVVRHLTTGTEDTLLYVMDLVMARSAPVAVFHTSGVDSIHDEGVYRYDFVNRASLRLRTAQTEYTRLAISDDGSGIAFLSHDGHKKDYVPPYKLNYWEAGLDTAEVVVSTESLGSRYVLSPHGDVLFSENGERLFFGYSAPPVLKDTSLLEDEIIQVEVWTYRDQRLQTQQEVEKERDEKKSFRAVLHTNSRQLVRLGSTDVPEVRFGGDRRLEHDYAYGRNAEPYRMSVSWEGFPVRHDIFLLDIGQGQHKPIATRIRGNGDLSPGGHYLYWYNVEDTAYYAYDIAGDTIYNLSLHIPMSITDEEDDHPDFPSPYGLAGWTENDDRVLIYDRYDVWQVNPKEPSDILPLTEGRPVKDRYRIRKLDSERPYLDLSADGWAVFNEETKDEAFGQRTPAGDVRRLIAGPFRIRNLIKARDAQDVVYSIEDNATSPDLYHTTLSRFSPVRLSRANPQQEARIWSTVELYRWISLDGIELEGLLYKPEGFDPQRVYPMIVYFYERNAHNLHRYWGAFPHRSIINPSYYASRGYLVFIPDIVYKDGYPGPSCYNAVVPGVTSLIEKGFVDKERIGMQGHSWGGYQTAYLATRTDLFACAESGAPVANMVSAYGGIRWGTGLSRMFQYEHTQSRLGGSLWDVPMRYFENSPIFFVDKINTPMLLMHNDHDTAVPWYQGIELFVALRRLGKPVWMLNYNNEPHWPTKRENIVDFNIRMQHFFDHYLLDQPMPAWMSQGVPAVKKGYDKGY